MKTSKQKRAENEVIFRQYNEHLKKLALKVLPDGYRRDYPITFICECSNENCREEIYMSINDYIKIHLDDKRFILKQGHQQGDIEKRILTNKNYEIVEKFETPPSTDGILNATN